MAIPSSNFQFVFRVAGEDQIKQSLGLAADAVATWRPAFDRIHEDFTSTVMPQQFASQGARGGSRWVGYQNEPVYAKIKKYRLGVTEPILRWARSSGPPESGERLYPSLVNPTHPDHVYEATNTTFRIGTRVPYAIKHQLGIGTTKYDKVPLPQRKIIDITPADRLRWARILQTYFMDAVGPGGRTAGRGAAGRKNPTFGGGGQ